jgi:hypothetical protein
MASNPVQEFRFGLDPNFSPAANTPVTVGSTPSTPVVPVNVASTGVIENRLNTYNFYKDYVGKQFVHLLDYYENGDRRITEPINTTPELLLASFVSSSNENEDPTYLGFDIYIKWNESPLFNGSVESFIETFKKLGNSEVGSRDLIISEFKKQFLKFFRVDAEVSAKDVPLFLGQPSPRAYYLKELSGLDNLVHSVEADKTKQFVSYGTDVITMKFYEDVTQNFGYLASLYKSLSWSRINGKLIIPENLLRFDVEIVVTDIRKFNRIVKNEKDNKIEIYADKLTNYKYTLYECQFLFGKMPHGDSLSTSSSKEPVDDYEIKFNYKFSTLSFNKLNIDPTNLANKIEFAIDNSRYNLSKISPKDTKNNSTNGSSISSSANNYPLSKRYSFDLTTKKNNNEGKKEGVIEDSKNAEKSKSSENQGGGESPDQVRAEANSNKPETENQRTRREAADRLNRLSNQARSAANTANANINSLSQNPLLNRANAFLNQSVAGQSPTLSNVGNRLLRAGRRQLNTQIMRQASLLDRTLSNIRFR